MSRFQPIIRNTDFLFPPSINDWLPEVHLARFVVEIVDQLDLKEMERAYRGTGSAPFHPALLLSVLTYGYATGVFSSRKLEAATRDSVAFRYVAANLHPDHDTLNSYRKRFLPQIEGLMVQVLLIARTMGVLKLGNIALDGTKIHANASRHSALSYGHIKQLEAQLQAEVKKLLALAEEADNEKIPTGLDLPDEIARREDRLKAIGQAKAKIEERARERFEQEQTEYQGKLSKREAKARETGKPPRGKAPLPPQEGAKDKDQINLTDEESRIMKTPGGGFEQCYNAQLAVDMESYLITSTNVVQAANDKQQVGPMLEELVALPVPLGKIETLVADTGYFSEANVETCCGHKITPLIAVKRESHHPDPLERFTEPPPLPAGATEVEKMRHRLKTKQGKEMYAKRKSTVEPVIGIVKSA
ncbi:MAG TPA: IS1182 family transposase, partial [Gallionella sp.]|nr:IS1182 family transposase [Gallionella sp.]